MYIDSIEFFPISIPYTHKEISSQVHRSGVSDVIIKIKTADGLIGWGECCSGADIYSVLKAAEAMKPFVLKNDPFEIDNMKRKVYWDGLWQFRKGTANFVWAGYEMALLDIQGKAVGQPLYNLLGGKIRDEVDYFYYMSQGPLESIKEQAIDGLEKGFTVFYIKAGIDFSKEIKMLRTLRETIGDSCSIRIDVNTAWSQYEAKKYLSELAEINIDFIEGPIVAEVDAMRDLKLHSSSIPICANEGLWSSEQAYELIAKNACDVINISPYWVGSFFDLKALAMIASMKGISICKHTHGEFSISAMASQHLFLNLPSVVMGNQQTAYIMDDDIATSVIPISSGPKWGVPEGVGLCLDVDEDKLRFYADKFAEIGQFLPYGSI